MGWGTSTSPLASNSAELAAGSGTRPRPAGRVPPASGDKHTDRCTSHRHYRMNGAIVGKLDGKVAVITGATSGMALAGAKLFVDEGAHVPLDAGLLQDLQQGKRERREHDVLATANSRLARQARDLPLEALESVIKEAHYIAVGEAS